MRKIILVANSDWYLFNFRLLLARALMANGWDPVFASPRGPYAGQLREAGFRVIPIPMTRSGVFPFRELHTLRKLSAIYRRERPDLVHHHTIKPVIYGSLAAKRAGTAAIINSITGLGFMFLSNRISARALRFVVKPAYRFALRGDRVHAIFENQEDREFFLKAGLIGQERHTLIEGVGVDLARYEPAEEPSGVPVVILASRMLWDKGVGEFVEAARILRERKVTVRFVLVGAPDPGNPSTIREQEIQRWEEQGHIEWWGHRSDMPKVFASSHIVTLPSYAEGVPTVLLEAAASGRPIVATDIPGCREIVRHGETGYLVPVGDADSLAQALGALIANRELRKHMGMAGRALAESRFDQRDINQRTLRLYEQVLEERNP